MYNPDPIFKFVEARQTLGQAVVLVTIAAVSASSSRNPGTHLAVSEDGALAGSLTGGCIEAAVAAEAVEVLRDGLPRITRYGQGSRYLDIRLPCGGSLDLLFSPIRDPQLGHALVCHLDKREPFRLGLSLTACTIKLSPGTERFEVEQTASQLIVNHIAPLRCTIVGQGAAVEVLRDLGTTIGIESIIYSPDRALVERMNSCGSKAKLLTSMGVVPDFQIDRSTAAILMLHDHEWEPAILERMLTSNAFFLGAMGSRIVHAQRLEKLRKLGFDDKALERIVAPVGLIPSMRDPETLAVSIISQIIERFNRNFLAF